MKLHSFALLAGLVTLAIAPTASANLPIIDAATDCAEGSPSASWVVAMESTVNPWLSPPDAESREVSVELSLLIGGVWSAWTQYQVGELTFLNGHTFSGSATLPGTATDVRLRVSAIGAWYFPDGSYARNTSSYWSYATLTTEEAQAQVFPLPTQCAPVNPGTGTPGYWKNHAEAWPVTSLVLGGTTYTQAQLITILGGSSSRDVTYIMGRALIAALLNGLIGNDTSCIDAVVDDAQAWLAQNPVGSGLRGSSAAWRAGGAIATTLDDYNNGLLCAPHRD